MSVYCIGAAFFGLLMGYVFAWSSRQTEPSGNEVAALVSTVLGGTVLTILNQINCAEGLPLYVIGVAVGYGLYLFLLSRDWAQISHFVVNHNLKKVPFFPASIWRMADPCCNCNPPATSPSVEPNASDQTEQTNSTGVV